MNEKHIYIEYAFYSLGDDMNTNMDMDTPSLMMFEEMDVFELCTAIQEAFYKGAEYREHYITLGLELQERLELTSI